MGRTGVIIANENEHFVCTQVRNIIFLVTLDIIIYNFLAICQKIDDLVGDEIDE